MKQNRVISAVLAWSLAALPAIGTPPDDLPPQEIVNRAVARAEAQHSSGVETQFESRVVTSIQGLDGNGQVTRTDLTRYRQYPVQGALFEELIEKDGRPLTTRERETEEKNRNKFTREVEKRKKRGLHPQPEKRPGIRFSDRLMSRYRFKTLRTEMAGGHRCWVVSFEPGEGPLPAEDAMDHALNQSTGTMWISQDDLGLVRLDFVMRKPFKYWAGLLAVIRNTEGRLDFQRVEPDVWLPSHFYLKLDLNVMMVKDIRRLIKKEWTGYTRVVRSAAAR